MNEVESKRRRQRKGTKRENIRNMKRKTENYRRVYNKIQVRRAEQTRRTKKR